jgi:uncharacterized repeat protein (TIGR01451 family)
MTKSRNGAGRKTRAQAIVEFALVLPILLMIVYGLLEAGRILLIYGSIVTASREAARFGSANGLTDAGVFPYQDCDGIRAAARRVDILQAIKTIDITYDEGPGDVDKGPDGIVETYCGGSIDVTVSLGTGQRFIVRVCGDFEPIVTIIPLFTERPILERRCASGTGITFVSARTILGAISIPAEAPAPSGAVSLNKQANPMTYDSVGDVITYKFRIINSGNISITAPYTVYDLDLFGTFTCNGPSPLLPGGSFDTCTRTYTVTQEDLNNGSIFNRAYVTAIQSDDGSTKTSLNSTVTVTAEFLPKITLQKSANPTAVAILGDEVTYTYTIQNTGNVTLNTPYSVTDNKAPVVNCPGSGDLAPGATITCTGTYAVTQQDLNAGSVTNIATAEAYFVAKPITSNEASATVLTTPLLLTITPAPTIVNAMGQTVNYTYTLKNVGNTTLSSPYAISDDKYSGITCTQSPATLNPGATTTCSVAHIITQDDLDAGSIVNNASGTSNGDSVHSNPAQGLVTVTQTPQLNLDIIPDPSTATTLGQTVTYTYTLLNQGNVRLRAPYVVSDDKFTGVDCSGAASVIGPGTSSTCTYTHTVSQTDLDNGSIINRATVRAHHGSGSATVTSNLDSATVITFGSPRLTLEKTADPPVAIAAGQLITYTYKLHNTGNVQLTSPYTVSDDKVANVNCSGTTSPLPMGAETFCTGTYTTTPGDVSLGSVTNHATATAKAGVQTITSNQATKTVPFNTAICDVRHSALQTSPFRMTVYNFSSFAVNITQIVVDWTVFPSTQRLTSVLFNSIPVWSGSESVSPITIPLSGNVNSLSNKQIEIQFLQAYTSFGTERIQVSFAEASCPLLDSKNSQQLP